MGRGSSGAASAYSARYVTTAGNVQTDLGNLRLVYGGNDKALTGAARKAIEEFENKRYTNRLEFSRFVGADGSIIEENKGGKGSVAASRHARMIAFAMSHNHPRDNGSGQLGGTFSPSDLNNFANYPYKVMRATAAEGTYSISKNQNFDANGLRSYVQSSANRAQATYKAEHKAAMDGYNKAVREYNAGRVKYSDVQTAYNAGLKAANDAFNKLLVTIHDDLLAGQKKYGYSYTLERRK